MWLCVLNHLRLVLHSAGSAIKKTGEYEMSLSCRGLTDHTSCFVYVFVSEGD